MTYSTGLASGLGAVSAVLAWHRQRRALASHFGQITRHLHLHLHFLSSIPLLRAGSLGNDEDDDEK